MAVSSVNYTKNMVFECLLPGDTNITITGYVDLIVGRKWLSDLKKAVFIFRIHNTEDIQIYVYIWQHNIDLWRSQVSLYENLTITRGPIRSIPKYSVYNDTRLPIDFHLESFNEIIPHGKYNPQLRDSLIYTEVEFGTIAKVKGRVVLTGFIKDPFVVDPVEKYGCLNGSMADGAYRLTVYIDQFKWNPEFKRGRRVKLWGTLETNAFGGRYLKVSDMNHVKVLHDFPRMPDEDLNDSIISVWT